MRSRTFQLAGLAALTVVALAACGDDDDSTAATAAPAGTTAGTTVDTAMAATTAGTAAGAPEGTGGDAPTGLVFGIPSPLATEPGEHNINLGIECYADTIDGKVIVADSNLDVNKQVTDFDQLIAQGADVMPFLALDHDAFVGPFERADEAGVTVVELYNPDSAAPGSVYEHSAGAGEDAVKMVAEQFPDGANALVIGGPPIPAVTDRINGFTDNADEAKITILEQQDNLADNVQDARTLADDADRQAPRCERRSSGSTTTRPSAPASPSRPPGSRT